MPAETRANLSCALWLFSAVALVALFISAALLGALTLGHVLIAFAILALGIVGTPYLLRGTGSEAPQEKPKRQRIENLLRDMSDEELVELRQRLSDSDFSEASTGDSLGDDGEILRRS